MPKPQTTSQAEFAKSLSRERLEQIYVSYYADTIRLRKALSHALYNMSRDQQATMTEPTYEEALEECE